MNTAYIAVSYICNQKCSFCPCSKEEKKYSEPEWENLIDSVNDMMKKSTIENIVVSGGEPTLYSRFIEFLGYLCKTSLKRITVLSTSERFSDNEFVKRLEKNIDVSKVDVISTLHSNFAEEHEAINGTPNSFKRTIRGLKKLHDIGVKTTVKHCITKSNYRDLKSFYEFVNSTFDEDVDIQMCSIDYCGVPREEYEKQMLAFPDIAPYFEEMFDLYIENQNKGNPRNLYCIYMPLCSADPYYWDYFLKDPGSYSAFVSSADKGKVFSTKNENKDVGTFSDKCEICKVKSICSGTYKSAFEIYGSKIVAEY